MSDLLGYSKKDDPTGDGISIIKYFIGTAGDK